MLILHDLRLKAEWCYGRSDFRTLVKTLLTDGTAAMFWYRLMQWSQRHRLAPLAMLCNKFNAVLCQCIIGRGAEFGPGFVLIHSQGVVINGNVRGGSRIYIEHQVTIGAEKNLTPVLEDDIFIGAGAKVIGLAFPGNVTSSVCGTSFSTPRLAWLLAAREVMKGRVVPKFNVGALDVWMESNRALVLSLQNDSPEFLKRYDVHVDKLLGL